MKTRRMFLIALCGVAMLTGTSSCKKEKQENENGEKMVIKASLGSAGNNSKTHLEGPSVMWDQADAFKLFPTNGAEGEKFTLTRIDGQDGKVAYFEGTHPGDAPYYACYPSEVTCSNDGEFAFAIPQSQSDNTNAGPMVGYMKEPSGSLVFQNVMSWLEVGLKGNVVIKRVVLTDNSPSPANNKLNGTLTVSDIVVGDDDKISTFTTAMSGGTNQLEIVSNDGFQLTNDYTYFWFMVPAGSLASLNLSAYLDVAGNYEVLNLNRTIENGIGQNRILTANVNSPIIEGAISGVFTVGKGVDGQAGTDDDVKVYFSQGNLQYQAKPGTWRFAENQYDFVGDGSYGNVYEGGVKCNNASIASDYTGWIDLFGWGSTGNAPVDDDYYVHYQPWSIDYSSDGHSSSFNNYGYGPSTSSSSRNLSVSKGSDWGANAISNGGGEAGKGKWRTLTSGEWVYLLNSRSTSYGTDNRRYAEVKVNGVAGMLLFPDDFSSWPSSGAGSAPTTFNKNSTTWNSVNYTAEQFAVLQSAGCVFLPAAGYRYGTSVNGVDSGSIGRYWSSSYKDSSFAYYLNFRGGSVNSDYNSNRYYGYSVRLVVSEN